MRGSWVHLRRCCSSCSPLPGRFLKALFPVASRLLEKLSYGKSEQGARRLSGNGLNIARPLLGPMATWLHHLPFWGSKSLCEALVVVQSLSRVWLFVTPWTVACQAPLSMVFARQEYWSGLPFPTPGDLPDPGIELESPALAGWFFTAEPPRKPSMRWYTPTDTHSRERALAPHPGLAIMPFSNSVVSYGELFLNKELFSFLRSFGLLDICGGLQWIHFEITDKILLGLMPDPSGKKIQQCHQILRRNEMGWDITPKMGWDLTPKKRKWWSEVISLLNRFGLSWAGISKLIE